MRPLLKALRADPEIPLDVAALDLASIEFPALDAALYLRTLDEMAAAIQRQMRGVSTGQGFVNTANHYLFEERAFRGNDTGYYDPRNSCLNFVLEHRTGIPITLSLVYLEIARRILHRTQIKGSHAPRRAAA